MNTISETAYKANPLSPGIGVPYIQWINLGKGTVITPKDVYYLENKLADGYTFHMTIKGSGFMNLVSNNLPTEYGDLGRIDYTGINGYPVFYPQNYNCQGLNIWKVDLEDIYVEDSDGNQIYYYSFVAADAEQTNMFSYGVESNTFITQNGVWNLYDIVKCDPSTNWPHHGELDLNGLGSNIAQEIPVKEGYNYAPILLCQASTNCQITMISPHQRQAVAVGVMIQEQGINITKRPNLQTVVKKNNEEFFFHISFTASNFTTGYTEYRISDTLHAGLSVNLKNTTITQTINGLSSNVVFKTNIVNNTVDIIIPINNVTEGASININLAIKITNELLIPSEFFNVASLAVISSNPNDNKVAVSNQVKVDVTPYLEKTPKPKPTPPANPNPKPISKPNPIISHCHLYPCCCYCNNIYHKKHSNTFGYGDYQQLKLEK